MSKYLNLINIRAIQIASVVTFGLLFNQIFHIPHGIWIAGSIAVIYNGFHNGVVIERIYHRVIGTFAGLLLGIPLWFFIHLDYRILPLVAVILGVIAYFVLFAGPYYIAVMIYAVLSTITSAYLDPVNANFLSYFPDRFLCNFIGAVICLTFEYLWFARGNSTKDKVVELKNLIVKDTRRLIALFENKQILCSSDLLNMILVLNNQIMKLNSFIKSISYELHSPKIEQNELIHYSKLVNKIYEKVMALNYVLESDSTNQESYNELMLDINLLLDSYGSFLDLKK